jgi:hypothetical protein
VSVGTSQKGTCEVNAHSSGSTQEYPNLLLSRLAGGVCPELSCVSRLDEATGADASRALERLASQAAAVTSSEPLSKTNEVDGARTACLPNVLAFSCERQQQQNRMLPRYRLSKSDHSRKLGRGKLDMVVSNEIRQSGGVYLVTTGNAEPLGGEGSGRIDRIDLEWLWRARPSAATRWARKEYGITPQTFHEDCSSPARANRTITG